MRPDQLRHDIAMRNVLFALAYPETFDPPLTAEERYRCVERYQELRGSQQAHEETDHDAS